MSLIDSGPEVFMEGRVCSKSRVFSLRTLHFQQELLVEPHEHKPLLKSNSKVLQQDVHGKRLPWAFWGLRMVSNTVSIEGEKLPRPPGFRTDKASNALHSLQRVGVLHHLREIMAELEDRLSGLPQELQSHVLSVLPLHESLKTSILSKRWGKTWHSLPHLTFYYSKFPNMEGKRDHFLEFIRHTLIHHDESSIKEFEIYIEECDFDIKNEWVTIAVQHNVEKLALHGLVEDQQLPGCLFKCSSLITMNLVIENLLLKWPMDSSMPNLKNLKIDSVILSEENFILDLSSSCPALESLSLTLCNVMIVKVLSISSGRLKCLFIAGCQGITECFVKLDTPRLEHFFYMDFVARDYSFTNMSSLSLGCVWLGDDHQMQKTDDYSRCAIKVFQALCNGKHLTFNQPFMEFLSRAHYVWRLLAAISLDKLEGLTLYLWPTKEQVQMALLLLGRCPRIRTLIIDFARSEERLPDVLDQDVEFGNLASPLMFEQLTYMRIENFGGYKSEMELARVLFENAPDSGKMEIVTELSLTSTERKLKMAEILMLKGASNVNLHIT